MLGLSWLLGNVLGVDGAGRVLSSHDDLVSNALRLFGSMDSDQVAALSAGMPFMAVLLLLALVGGLIAGFTSTACSPSARSSVGAGGWRTNSVPWVRSGPMCSPACCGGCGMRP